MNINRHNYETFFLLYVDKELSAAEMQAVELFVQENPDLQMELSLLQDAVVKPEDIVLEKKDWLYADENASVLQESLLLYADSELSAADTKKVEALLATDKRAKSEWDLLRRTKLEADTTIVFEDKGLLYRKEEGRVIGMKWWRAAAAAILLGIGLWAGITVYRNSQIVPAKSQDQGLASNGSTGQPQNQTGDPGTGTADVNAKTAGVNESATASATGKKTEPDNPAKNTDTKSEERNKRFASDDKKNIVIQAPESKKEDNNLPKPNSENINRPDRNEFAVSNVKPENSNISTSGVNNVVVTTKPAVADPVAIPVAYAEEDTNNDRYLYMDEDKVRRTKIGGLLRKAKRLLERNANVKTGDGLKVAGFEIALK